MDLTDASATRYRSAFPTGLADLDKPAESNVIQEVSSVIAQPGTPVSRPRQEQLLEADQTARDHAQHPGLPHEYKPLLQTEGLHGAGAGVGLGSGPQGFADSDAHITSELAAIYTNIQKVLDIRHKYMRLSLQGEGDNPKDDPNWNVYPSPPEPAWYEENSRQDMYGSGGSIKKTPSNIGDSPPRTRDSNQNFGAGGMMTPHSPQTPKVSRRKRKPGQDIGEDFDMDDLTPLPGLGEMSFRLDGSGVYQVYENAEADKLDTPVVNVPTIREFYMDLEEILNVSSDGPSKSFAFRRLQYLEGKFNLYVLLNEYQEMADSKKVPHRDFYNVRKVDTHVHHSACMNQKHLLRFIKSKMKKSPDEVVMFRDGKHLTLEQVFQSINLTAYDLSIDTLDMHVR